MRSAGLLAAVAAIVALAAAPARADTVTDWNAHATTALSGQFPTVMTIHLAMVHGAVYDAVNAIDRRYEPYLVRPRARRSFSKDAAAATAAYRVLHSILIDPRNTNSGPARLAALEAARAASLAAIPDGPEKEGGIAVGETAGWAMIAARTDDGRYGDPGFPVGTGPGDWRPVPPGLGNDLNAWVADVEPFLIKRASQFRSPGPYDLDSRRYAREFEEVKSLGSVNSSTRSADQTDAARFWSEGPILMTRAARQLSSGFGLSIADNARMFAMQYLTGADALIAVWDDKRFWGFWRPTTAIREADTDGNPATEADPNWTSLLGVPPYSDHPSGLAGVVSAMCESLEDFFGTDRISFSAMNMNPPIDPPLTRRFDRFSQATQEVVDARVWSGIHFRNADEDGARIGKQVSRWRDRHYFEKEDDFRDRDDFRDKDD
jgi:hypothetical protein